MDSVCVNDVLKTEGVLAQGYGVSPRLVMRDTRLTVEAKAIYCYLAAFSGGGTTGWPGRDTMIEELGISAKRYYHHLNLLKECDYLRIERLTNENGMKTGNVYILVSNPESSCEKTVADRRKENAAHREQEKKEQRVATQAAPASASAAADAKIAHVSSGAKAQKNDSANEKDGNMASLRMQLQIDSLAKENPDARELLESILMAAYDMATAKELYISHELRGSDALQEVVRRLRPAHVLLALKALRENQNIKNRRKYIQTILTNGIYEDAEGILSAASAQEDTQREAAEKQIVVDEREQKISTLRKNHPRLSKLEEAYCRVSSQLCLMAFADKNERAALEEKRKALDAEVRSIYIENGINPDAVAS